MGLSAGEYTVRGSSLVGKLTFARSEVAVLTPAIDADRDGHVTAAEVDSARGLLRAAIFARILVTSAGATCVPSTVFTGLTEQDGLFLSGRWDCPTSASPFEVEFSLLDDLARGHRHVARIVTGLATHEEVLTGADRRLSIAPEPEALTAPASEVAPARDHAAPAGVWSFFEMGIEHILTGYDHLVFIVGLVLARARWRSLVAVVTAFTVAHSLTLAVAVLGVWAPSARVVEPAIALSIAYVGIENFFVEDASRRWRITFPFGLVHGFGFAGALQQIALPRDSVPAALLSFNFGVEMGQLAVLAVLLPLVYALRDQAWFEPRGVRLVSAAVAIAGGVWFIQRVVG